jgi:4-hydroxybenzoate polyprenyltransferase
MRQLAAFFQLVRLPNLLFIAFTQTLFLYCVVLPAHHYTPGSHFSLEGQAFWLLLSASVFIAAGGYVINDYFDLNIDRFNRPDRMVIERSIPRRHAIIWHLLLSAAGIACSLGLTYTTGNLLIALVNIVVVVVLWLYSTTFKRQLLAGNIVISMLTAWVILVIYVSEAGPGWPVYTPQQALYLSAIYKPAIVYAGFAFIMSVIREAVKDMEDRLGDQRDGRMTMAVAWGLRSTKVYSGTWLVVLILSVVAFSVYFAIRGEWAMPALMGATVLLPCGAVLRRLWTAQDPETFGMFSKWLKWAMLGGTSSMLLLLG